MAGVYEKARPRGRLCQHSFAECAPFEPTWQRGLSLGETPERSAIGWAVGGIMTVESMWIMSNLDLLLSFCLVSIIIIIMYLNFPLLMKCKNMMKHAILSQYVTW